MFDYSYSDLRDVIVGLIKVVTGVTIVTIIVMTLVIIVESWNI